MVLEKVKAPVVLKTLPIPVPRKGEVLVKIVPGGFSTRKLQKDSAFIQWLQTAKTAGIVASVCTGSLLLGAAGFLKDKTATTHPSAYDDLKPYCKSVSKQRICDQGNIITAGGVTSSIDLGLYLVEKISNPETKLKIASQMDYLLHL